MTEYEIKDKYIIKAGDIMTMTNDVYYTDIDAILPKGTIVEVLKTTSNEITIKVLKSDKSYLKGYSSIVFFSTSPAEDFYFYNLIKSLERLTCPDLLDAQIPVNNWTKIYLRQYIEFLEIQIDDLEA